MGCWFEGPAFRWAFLFSILSQFASAQVVVVNGLGHFHPWDQPAMGSIVLMNPTDDSLRVIVQNDSLWGPRHPLRIASEVRMPPQSRKSLPYEWMEIDSSSQGVRIYLSTVTDAAPTPLRRENFGFTSQPGMRWTSTVGGSPTTSGSR